MKVKRISSNITNKPVQNYENHYGIVRFKFLNISKISTLVRLPLSTRPEIFLFSTNIQKSVRLSSGVLFWYTTKNLRTVFARSIILFFSHDASDCLYTSKSASPILYKQESVSNQMSHKDYNQ